MSPLATSAIVFACIFGGALLGMVLRTALPEHHLSAESKDVVKVGMGVVGTMAALVLGLLVASAKCSYDAQRSELMEMSANIALLDRILAHYGPETKEARELLRRGVAGFIDSVWAKTATSSAPFAANPSRYAWRLCNTVSMAWSPCSSENNVTKPACTASGCRSDRSTYPPGRTVRQTFVMARSSRRM